MSPHRLTFRERLNRILHRIINAGEKREVELRGYLNYTSLDYQERDIDIDCVIVVPNERSTIITGSERIKQKVKRRLGAKLASMLKFGVSEANPSSANHFLFRRHGDEWNDFD